MGSALLADAGGIGSAVRRPGLHLERLVGDEIALAVPSDHPFAGRVKVAVGKLRGQPLILREEGSGARRRVEAGLEAARLGLPQGITQAILQAVAQGLGVGFVSARASAQAQADGHLASVGLEGVDLQRVLCLAYMLQRAGDPLVAHFVDFAREQFAG